MTSKHTPGPWAVYDGQWGDHSDGEGGGFQIIMGPYDGGAIRHINLINYADGQYAGDTGHAEAEANARLIAAAPKMLPALRDLADAVRSSVDARQHPALTEALFEADHAIVEAEGSTP